MNLSEIRKGEVSVAKNGMKMTILVYRNNDDIDIQFEDGYVVTHTTYNSFKSGVMRNPNVKYYPSTQRSINLKNSRIGEVCRASNGMLMTLIAYRGVGDVDVQFEDGAIAEHREYSLFKRGKVGHPSSTHDVKKNQARRVGEVRIAKNGRSMTIIAYRTNKDIDIQFDDGTRVEHQRYAHFVEGEIKYPQEIRVGKTLRAKNGQMMTCIQYRDVNDIDIQFEDKTIVTNKSWGNFIKGNIKNPNVTYSPSAQRSAALRDMRIGTTAYTNSGVQMTITDYHSCADIDVVLETGVKLYHIAYSAFLRGNVRVPLPYQHEDILIESIAYSHKGVCNFYCKCNKCGFSDIMTVAEMGDHICRNS